MIRLADKTITNEQIDKLREWLGGYPRLTKGELCIQFEEEFAKWIGCNFAVYVNSGSAANLLALAAYNECYRSGEPKKVVVPALSWATDISPLMQLGMEPILCDCNMDDLSVDIEHLERIFEKDHPYALILVSVLGLVPDMTEILRLCNKHGVFVMEDVCESLGSKCKGKKLGTFGNIATTSFYYGHQMSTIEGGMVFGDDPKFRDIICSMRSHGWVRDTGKEFSKNLKEMWEIDDFRNLYTFYYPGFNFRNTEIGAFLGLEQLKNFDSAVKKRNENFLIYQQNLHGPWWEDVDDFVSCMAYPIFFEFPEEKYKKLEEKGVESRPLIAGSMGRQPFFIKKYGRVALKNADYVHNQGMQLPCNPDMTKDDVEKICGILREDE